MFFLFEHDINEIVVKYDMAFVHGFPVKYFDRCIRTQFSHTII
jgi:hypothetical protein